MKRLSFVLFLILAFGGPVVINGAVFSEDQEEIKDLTEQFRKSILDGDLSVLDRVFDPDPSNIYYDINEGPLVGLERLKRVWRAATRNSRLTGFEFGDDMKIEIDGNRALQTSSWTQTQVQEDGASRNIQGRASILWHKTDDGWRVYHYHASITPRRMR
jgi:ketosteroid isomerase-like protein